jgi:hypothetical protein
VLEHIHLPVGSTLQMRMRLKVATAVTASDHRWLWPTRFRYATAALLRNKFLGSSAPRSRSDGPLEPDVSTRFESSPTSDVCFVTARSSFVVLYDSRQPLRVSFRRPESLRRSTCSSHVLSDIPNRLERSSLPRTRRYARLPNALTPSLVSISRSNP